MRLLRVTLLSAGGVLIFVLTLAVTPSVARAAFCSCGYTSKEVRSWNNHYLATPAGQARIATAVTHEILVNPPALAPFIDRAGVIVKRRSKGVAAHSLSWFKKVYLKCPDGTPGCKAMRQCLIAGYTTYVVDRGAGIDKATALKAATVACIVAAFQSLASGGRVHESSHSLSADAHRDWYRPYDRLGGDHLEPALAA